MEFKMVLVSKCFSTFQWAFELVGFRGYMSFPATFSKITGSSLEVVTDWSFFLNGGRVNGRVGGRVCGRVDSRVWRGGGASLLAKVTSVDSSLPSILLCLFNICILKLFMYCYLN